MLFTTHDKRVAKLYGSDVDKWLATKEKPFRNWGYWTDSTEDHNQASQQMMHFMADKAKIVSGDTVLDVGCGFGISTIEFFKKGNPSKIIGIDLAKEQLAYGQKWVTENNLSSQLELIPMSATDLKFETEKFTKIIAMDCTIHFQSRMDFLKESYRTLAPKGELILLDQIILSDNMSLVNRTFLFIYLTLWSIPKENVFDIAQYKEMMSKVGFKDVSSEEITSNIYPKAMEFMSSDKYKTTINQHYSKAYSFFWQIMLKMISKLIKADHLKCFFIRAYK